MKNVNNQVELIKKKLHDEAFLRSRGWKSLGLSSWAWDKAWPEPQLGLLLKSILVQVSLSLTDLYDENVNETTHIWTKGGIHTLTFQ